MSESKENIDLEMFVVGLVLDPSSNTPIVILKDVNSDICLPIWIGTAEASAIAMFIKGMDSPRPMTHDLLKDVIHQFGGKVVKILISGLRENTFISNIEIACGDVYHVIDARPSDAIALAVRTSSPIIVARAVLDQAQVRLVAVEGMTEGELQFRPADGHPEGDFVNFANIDKEQWAEILDGLNPEDFKYKM